MATETLAEKGVSYLFQILCLAIRFAPSPNIVPHIFSRTPNSDQQCARLNSHFQIDIPEGSAATIFAGNEAIHVLANGMVKLPGLNIEQVVNAENPELTLEVVGTFTHSQDLKTT